MYNIRYSDDFYVNDFPNKGIEYAKGHIEAFMNKLPQHLMDYLEKKNYFGESKPGFQAVIIGEPKISMFGKPQVAILMIHSNFIAYTTASDYQSPINRTYGYATFDNKLAVTRVIDHLEIQSAYEKLVVGFGTESIDKDFDVILKLFERNAKAIEDYFEQLEEQGVERAPTKESSKGLQTSSEAALNEEDGSTDEELGPSDLEWAPSMEESEEIDSLAIEPHETTNDIFYEEEYLNEQDTGDHVPTNDQEYEEDRGGAPEPMSENVNKDLEEQKNESHEHVSPDKDKKSILDTNKLDSRFRAQTLIISNDSIPQGFIFREPVVYAYSVRAGVFKNTTPQKAYVQAYETCLDMIRDDIADGQFDAVFNLQFSANSVDNYYEVVVTGDAVVYQNEE